MSKKSEIELINFFIFNAKYGPKEGEEDKKIMFYYPTSVDSDKKIKQVGLCEAITKFTSTFTENACESLHTQKTRQLFYMPETDFWIIMTVSIPQSQKTRDGETFTEFHDDDVQDSVYRAVVMRSYKLFRLFNGTFSGTVETAGVDCLKKRLDQFFSKYLPTLKLNQSDILDVFNGINFLPLDKNAYLRIQCFVNQVQARFTQIQYTAFLYNNELVWSGLEQDEMRILYHYLITSLFPSHLERELHGNNSGNTGSARHYGKFILGPPNVQDKTNPGKIPRVYVGADGPHCSQCHLVVYHALGATICLLLNDETQLNFDFWQRLDKVLGHQLGVLASDIGEQYARRSNTSGSTADLPFRYVYFNHLNLAMKTTVHSDAKKTSNVVSVSPEVLRILADLHDDLNRDGCGEEGETIVKMAADCWVVAKKADQREFYVVLAQRGSNLIEVNEEVKRLCSVQFNNIFFSD